MDTQIKNHTSKALCYECQENESTRQITIDIDIKGIPICDSNECEHKARVRLMMVLLSADDNETDQFMNLNID